MFWETVVNLTRSYLLLANKNAKVIHFSEFYLTENIHINFLFVFIPIDPFNMLHIGFFDIFTISSVLEIF